MKGSKLYVFLLVLLFTLTSATYADSLEYGSQGTAVTKLQQQLAGLGYFKGASTGYYGSKTQEAVKKFQAAKGISKTGTVGPQTTKALSTAWTSSKIKTSSKGNTVSAAVKKTQEILKKMGLYKGKVDGLNGNLTSAAIKEFQKKYGIKSTGILDKITEKKILDHYASTASSSRSSSTSARQGTKAEPVNAVKQEVQQKEADPIITETAVKATEEITNAIDASVAEEVSENLESVGEEQASSIEAEASGELDEAVSGDEQSKVEVPAKSEEPAKQDDSRKIEVLDWWKAANKVFARGSEAKVIDVRTGKSFYIKRTYGGNHADCETLTKEDTKILKDIWGGFNWSRRPILVEIDGRLLAASMSGMPHAGLDNKTTNAIVSSRSVGYGRGVNLDAVKNNGMDGHFDIHFKNSRTHGSNRVDQAHQRAIKEAAAARL